MSERNQFEQTLSSTDPLFVSIDWLQEHYHQPALQVIDARMLPVGQENVRDVEEEYRAGHLPQAVFFNIESLSDHSSPYPHMMLRPEAFAVAMRELGVHGDKHLIIYDEGNLFSAPRAWWMLRYFGAEKVSILAGGLAAWKAAGLTIDQGAFAPEQSDFEANVSDKAAIKSLNDVLLISHEGGAQITDARSAERYRGEVDEPRAGLYRGHIPGALNVPWNELVEDGRLKADAALSRIFREHGVNLDRPVISSCGSGVTAAVVLLALTQLGVENLSLYDGSWGEWGTRSDLPGVDVQHQS